MDKPEYILDGIKLPTPGKSGAAVTVNRIWSSNAGRNSSTGLFIGDIIARKYTVALTYETLTQDEMQILWNVTSTAEPWHTLVFPLNDGSIRSITCYTADVTYTIRRFDLRSRKVYYDGVTLEMIEQ